MNLQYSRSERNAERSATRGGIIHEQELCKKTWELSEMLWLLWAFMVVVAFYLQFPLVLKLCSSPLQPVKGSPFIPRPWFLWKSQSICQTALETFPRRTQGFDVPASAGSLSSPF